jgi:hypothetical protein
MWSYSYSKGIFLLILVLSTPVLLPSRIDQGNEDILQQLREMQQSLEQSFQTFDHDHMST